MDSEEEEYVFSDDDDRDASGGPDGSHKWKYFHKHMYLQNGTWKRRHPHHGGRSAAEWHEELRKILEPFDSCYYIKKKNWLADPCYVAPDDSDNTDNADDDSDYDGEDEERVMVACACSHPIFYKHYMVHKPTGTRVRVGSCCVKQAAGEGAYDACKRAENMYKKKTPAKKPSLARRMFF